MTSGNGRRFVISAVCSTLLMALASASAAAEPLTWSAPADRATCPAGPTALWIEPPDGPECVRYFSSGILDGAPVVLVYLRGDRQMFIGRQEADIPDNTAEAQERFADTLAKRVPVPVVVLERPGTYGSSGDHRKRRQKQEFDAINAAVDALKAAHHIGRLALLGHSGGATAVAALLTYGRKDIACAVIESGAFDLLERARLLRARNDRVAKPGRDTTGLSAPYDPLQHLDGVVHDSTRSIIVAGDPQDQVTPYPFQQEFADRLRDDGNRVILTQISGRAPSFHNPGMAPGLMMMSRCLDGVGG